jgi:hypothetical protein
MQIELINIVYPVGVVITLAAFYIRNKNIETANKISSITESFKKMERDMDEMDFITKSLDKIDKDVNFIVEAFKKMDKNMDEMEAIERQSISAHNSVIESNDKQQEANDIEFYNSYSKWRSESSLHCFTELNKLVIDTLEDDPDLFDVTEWHTARDASKYSQYVEECSVYGIESVMDKFQYSFYRKNMLDKFPPPPMFGAQYRVSSSPKAKYLPDPMTACAYEFEKEKFGRILSK